MKQLYGNGSLFQSCFKYKRNNKQQAKHVGIAGNKKYSCEAKRVNREEEAQLWEKDNTKLMACTALNWELQ